MDLVSLADFDQTASERVLPVCFSNKHFVNSSPDISIFYLRTERDKCSNFRTFAIKL